MPAEQPPILVCGPGVVGLSAAVGLARAGFEVHLLGPHAPVARPAGEDYHPRVFAISPASQRLFERLGVWSLLDARRVTPIEAMEVFGDAGGQLDLSAWQDAQAALAWIVEGSALEHALQQAVQFLGVPWVEAEFTGLQPIDGGVCVQDHTGRSHQAALLVGADGARSPVRRAAGIEYHEAPFAHRGLVAHLDCERAHQNRAFQWFADGSILALLPMPDTAAGPQVSMVWSVPIGLAHRLQALDRAQVQAELAVRLQAITAGRLGALRLRSPLYGFPLARAHSAWVAPGVALVGDAAHRVHPLAGQGLNLGLGDVQTLVEVLRGRAAHRPLGDARLLARYRRRRIEPLRAMLRATNGLFQLFESRSAPLAWARNLGMNFVNEQPGLTRRLIRAASGLDGDPAPQENT